MGAAEGWAVGVGDLDVRVDVEAALVVDDRDAFELLGRVLVLGRRRPRRECVGLCLLCAAGGEEVDRDAAIMATITTMATIIPQGVDRWVSTGAEREFRRAALLDLPLAMSLIPWGALRTRKV